MTTLTRVPIRVCQNTIFHDVTVVVSPDEIIADNQAISVRIVVPDGMDLVDSLANEAVGAGGIWYVVADCLADENVVDTAFVVCGAPLDIVIIKALAATFRVGADGTAVEGSAAEAVTIGTTAKSSVVTEGEESLDDEVSPVQVKSTGPGIV